MKKYIQNFIQNTLASYAKEVIERHDPFVIAVTGSVGKSSTKEAVYGVLHDYYGDEVRKNEGNINSRIGLALTILGYKQIPHGRMWPFFLIFAKFKTKESNYPKYLVLEMGVAKPGDMDFFGKILKPDIGIITAITPAHIGNFDSLSEFQKEKLKMVKLLKKSGQILINIDDSVLMSALADNATSIGIDNIRADYVGEDYKITAKGTDFRIKTLGQNISIKSALIGKHLIYPQIFAFAVGQIQGIQSLEIKKSLEKIKPMPGRMNILSGKNGIIIDDTYNASPTSVKAALDFLFAFDQSSRKIAILGGMNELGDYEKEAHCEVGKYASNKCNIAIFIGSNAQLMAESFGDSTRCYTFANRLLAEKALNEIIRPKDVILIKASQNNNYFEEITKKLMLEPEKASTLLVRQNGYWNKKKYII